VQIALLRTAPSCLLTNSNVLAAISNDMQAAKLCSDKIFRFSTANAGENIDRYNGIEMVVVVVRPRRHSL